MGMTSLSHAALALLVVTTPLAAQRAPAAAGVVLPARQLVMVRTTGGARFYGRALQRTADSLVLSAPGADGRRATTWAAVDSLWVQDGTAALPAGITTALLLGAVSASLSRGFSGGDYGPPCRAACVARASVGGAAMGFVLGAALGHLLPRWRLRYAGA